MPKTLVFVHAHPDDEALLTAGTMARAAAEGQRVVLVVATDGAAGLAATDMYDTAGGLAARRAVELDESCRALGVHRLVRLGYADSGLHGDEVPREGGPIPLCAAPVEESANALAAILREESADVVVTYDANGGYGHPDHIDAKRASMAAHASQATADSGDRTLAAFLRMPRPLYRRVFGTEWYRLRP